MEEVRGEEFNCSQTRELIYVAALAKSLEHVRNGLISMNG